mmetsp:Transcript_26777/g.52366  ORF Transcript_26777/g.52366 Transcript_26777/m.52366 type:complete len:278 (+) Transcript_26777:23-856(+)|eukprot:CAMPEP_0172861684 /NCGR_PEP_ID=MMETSP1075-20121228/72799_1 /TAXON_ID=2916 /ORGANISM="Ceratium fusus, Strain PA161109" /LENGTH=277 /DNA_ID=CAMNT_0013709845 /DNA_START=23 /DNA_END=856 /DNA_ORIENTATION=-
MPSFARLKWAASKAKPSGILGFVLLALLAIATFLAWWTYPWDFPDRLRVGGFEVSREPVPDPGDGLLPSPALVKFILRQKLLKVCDEVFTQVDHNSNGKLNSAELHVAVLLIYDRLNKLLGDMALDVPASEEVRDMIIVADRNGDGQLNRNEFKKVFIQRFLKKISARVTARVLTHRVLVPLGAMALGVLETQYDLRESVEDHVDGLVRYGHGLFKSKNLRFGDGLAARRLAGSAVLHVWPLMNLKIVEELAKLLRIEKLVGWPLGVDAMKHEVRDE